MANALATVQAELISINIAVRTKDTAIVKLVALLLSGASSLGKSDPTVITEGNLVADGNLARASITELVPINRAVGAEDGALVELVALAHLGGFGAALSGAGILGIANPAVGAELMTYGDLAGGRVAEFLILDSAVAAHGGARDELVTLVEGCTVRDGSGETDKAQGENCGEVHIEYLSFNEGSRKKDVTADLESTGD